MRLSTSDSRILLRLERGEEIMSSISRVTRDRDIQSATIFGLGAIEAIDIGAFDLTKKEYVHTPFSGSYELINLIGNVGWADGEPAPHVHITISDHECRAYGGHLFSAVCYATVELTLWPDSSRLERKMVDEIGLKLWSLPDYCG